MGGMDLPATDPTLVGRQNISVIGEVTPSRDDSQKQDPNGHVSYLHGLTPFAICLTSPYHFQMA